MWNEPFRVEVKSNNFKIDANERQMLQFLIEGMLCKNIKSGGSNNKEKLFNTIIKE